MTDFFDSSISFGQDKRQTVGIQPRTLRDYLAAVITDSPLKRQARGGSENAKSALPVWVFGVVGAQRNDANTVNEGIFQIDIDAPKGENAVQPTPAELERLKAALIECPVIKLAHLSASGRGVFALGAIQFPADAKETDKPAMCKRAMRDVMDFVSYRFAFDNGCRVSLDGDTSKPYLDYSCANASRLRFEAYDPNLLVSDNPMRYCVDYEDAFRRSSLPGLIQALNPAAKISSASGYAGMVSQLIAGAASGRVSARLESKYYPARSTCVYVGQKGVGKSTLMDTAKTVVRKAREDSRFLSLLTGGDETDGEVFIDRPNSSVSMEQSVYDACTTVVDGTKGKTEQRKQRKNPECPWFVFDEGADEVEQRVSKGNYKQGMDAVQRLLFDIRFSPSRSMSNGRARGDWYFAALTSTFATPEAYANAVRVRGDRGEGRRESIFFLERNSQDTDGRNAHFAPRDQIKEADYSALVDAYSAMQRYAEAYAERSNDDGHTLQVDGNSPEIAFALGCFFETMARNGYTETDIEDAMTRLCSYAGLFTFLETAIRTKGITIGGRPETIPMDVGAFYCACAFELSILGNRRKLQGCETGLALTNSEKVRSDLLRQIEVKGKIRLDTALRNAGAERRSECADLIKEGFVKKVVIVNEKSGRRETFLMCTTDDERAAILAQREKESLDACEKYDGGSQRVKREPVSFPDCSNDEQARRFDSYVAEAEKDKPLVEGNRNNALTSLAMKLHKVGMNTETSKQRFIELCVQHEQTVPQALHMWNSAAKKAASQ